MNMRPLNRLRFLCVSMLTLFVIGLDFAWAVGLSPVSRPRIDGAFCGQYVMHYAPVGTYLSFDPSNSYAQCGKSIVDYTWNFDDGNTQSSGYPYPVLHSYSSPGLYVPTLTVTDSEGFTDTSQGYVTVFKGEILATSDSQINLQDTGGTTATIRYKVLPTNINPAFSPISVTLKIKQGGTEIRSISLSRSTGDQQTTWDGRDNSGGLVSGGIYVATLEVVGDTNTHFSNGHEISVLTPPVAHIRDGTVAYLNTAVTFDGSGSYDPDDGTGSGLGITTWSWSFTGGTPESVTTTTSGASTTYSALGDKEVTLTVTDNEGETNSTTRTISVLPLPPVADAGENQTVALNTTEGDNGVATTNVTVNFDGSGSYDPDDSGDSTVIDKGITGWKWEFTDGNPAAAGTKTPSTTYTTAGDKTVTLTVTDNEGNTGSTTCTVTAFGLVISSTTLPNDAVSFTTIDGEDEIQCVADIKPDSLDTTYNSQIQWEIQDNPDVNGDSGDPNDSETGNAVTLTVTAPAATAGRNYHLNYRIRASLTIGTATAYSNWKLIQQDNKDYLRQQYQDMDTTSATRDVPSPARTSNALVTAAIYVNPGNLSFTELNCNGAAFCINHAYQLDDTISADFQHVRNELGSAITVTSCYRCPRWNQSVGGADSSRHIAGHAFDFNNGSAAANWNVAIQASDPGGAVISTGKILLYSQTGARKTLQDLINGEYNATNLPPGWTTYRNGHISTD